MKKSCIIVAALIFSLGLSSVAGAVPYTWTDVYDPNPDIFFSASSTTHSYRHSILEEGFQPGEDLVLGYTLSIGLYDDRDIASEYAFINLPGLLSDGIFEIDYTDVARGWSIMGLLQLNIYGTLDVQITRMSGDFYLGDSTLVARGDDASPAPVPEPATMLLLGTGLLGLAGFRRKTS